MSIKRKLSTAAIFTGALIGTMHVVNRIFNYISTADNYLGKMNTNFMTGDSEELHSKKREQENLYYLSMI